MRNFWQNFARLAAAGLAVLVFLFGLGMVFGGSHYAPPPQIVYQQPQPVIVQAPVPQPIIVQQPAPQPVVYEPPTPAVYAPPAPVIVEQHPRAVITGAIIGGVIGYEIGRHSQPRYGYGRPIYSGGYGRTRGYSQPVYGHPIPPPPFVYGRR